MGQILSKFFLPGTLLLVFCHLTSTSAFGQTIQDFKEIWVRESREFLLTNQNPLPYLQSGFHQFSQQQDENFTQVLQQNWKKLNAVPGTPVPKSRKFDPAPQFVFEESSYHNPQFIPCFVDKNSETDLRSEAVKLPRIRKPEYTSAAPIKQSFQFYGNNIVISYDRLLSLTLNQPITSEIIRDYWKRFVVGNSQHLIAQLMSVRDRLGLNDWGYFLLIKTCSMSLYPKEDSGNALLTWALMIRSGFDVKIGYNQLGASVLYPSTSKIYSKPYLKIDDSDYYVDGPIASFPISTYTSNHAEATGMIHLSMTKSLNFQGDAEIKTIQFNWDKKIYAFNLKYNPEVTRYLEDYPSIEPELCFSAPFTALSLESIRRQVKPVIAGMKKEEAVAFLQTFVQKSFAYCPYNDMYGRDRFMFPEELLFKDQSNDKGKSLLFAWMIKNLLNQQAALVEFPGFYSVAISMDQPLDGDCFQADGKNFTIADPTFDNAPLGLVMKEFYPQKPIIRVLSNSTDFLAEQDKIWDLAHAFGAERSGAERDFVKDENGNSYITGFFEEMTTHQNFQIPTPFVAKFDENRSLVWMVKFRSSGRAFGLELKQLGRDEFYLTGAFRGSLEFNGKKIQTVQSEPDLFFAQFNSKGELAWLTKSGIDELEEETKLFYITRFTRSGAIQSVQLANEDERNGITGFQQNSGEGLCYVASRYQSLGLDKTALEPIPKSPLLLRQKLNRMRQLGREQTIATLASILMTLNYPENLLTAADLTSLEPERRENISGNQPNATELLRDFKSLKNSNGIVELKTANSKDLQFGSYKIENHSKFMIVPFDNNDLKIKIINGFQFESGTLHERINSIIVELSTGNIILDMGNQHQIISRNLKHEILK